MTRNRLFRGLLLMLALALCLTWVTGERVTAAAEDEELEIVSSYPYTTVTRVKVNLRASRSVKSALLKRIPEGAEITVTEKNGNWAHVEYKGTKGWVRTEYIVLKTVKKIKVTPTPTPAPTLSPVEDAGGYIVLQRGSSGAEVQALQEALIELGFLKGNADGNFGEATEKAVIAFQQKNKYPDTGLVDANLQAFLYSGKPLNAKGEATKIKTLSPAEGVTMRSGNTGEPVAQLQAKLKELGYYAGDITRKYDTATSTAVKAFQKTNGLKADGLAGAETRKLLDSGTALPADATPAPAATAEPTPTPEPVWEIPKSTVKNGSEGADAKAVQTRLKELGYYQGKVDGKFGRASMNALKNFQTNNGLKADGVAGKDTYEELVAWAKKYDVLIVHDNAYSDIIYTDEPGGSFLKTPGAMDVGVEFFSLSKSFNVTGARISFLLGRRDVVDAVRKLRSQIDFGMFLPIQKAAIAALTGPLDSVRHQCALYRERRDALCGGARAIGWNIPDAKGSMFVWAPIPAHYTRSMDFCMDLLEKAGVLCTPGSSFGPHGEGYVRFALVLPPEKIAQALASIQKSGVLTASSAL